MNKKKNVVLALLLIVIMTVLSGCATFDNFKNTFFTKKGAVADTVKIGVFEPEIGTDSAKGKLEVEGIKLANSLVDEVLGKKVELIYADTQSSIDVAETAIQDLITKKPAVVLGSSGEAESLMASDYLAEAKIPAITITASNPLITNNNEYYFRVNFTDASQAKAIAQYAQGKLLSDTAAVVRTKNDDTATSLVREFTNTFKALVETPESIVARITVDPEEPNYKDYVGRLKDSGAKTVFMPVSLLTAEKVFEEASKQKYFTSTFIGTKDWHKDELIALQKKFPGIRIAVASDFNAITETGVKQDKGKYYDMFINAYKEANGDKEPEEATALAFDAYMVAVEAIEKAKSIDGYLVKEALKTTKGFTGASGGISFDKSGEPKKTINIDVVRGDKFVSVYTID